MKTFILVAAFLGALSSASAATFLNLDIQAADQQGNQVGTAHCRIAQNLSNDDLAGTWSCAFNGGANQTLNASADYLADATDAHPQQIDYTLANGDGALGDFIFNGLKLVGVRDSVPLIISLGQTPSTDLPFLMVSAADTSSDYTAQNFYYLNLSLRWSN